VTINWNQNHQNDTYGYIIYLINENGFTVEIDTVWGLTNTSYTYSTNVTTGALSYSISAFDSCYTSSIIPTYQTSAKAEIQTTVFLRSTVGVCDNKVSLIWTNYIGWSNLLTYEIWGHIIGQPWVKFGNTNGNSYAVIGEPLADYCFAIRAISSDGKESFSNLNCLNIIAPSQPEYNYLKVATVLNEKVELRHLIDLVNGVKSISYQRLNKKGQFEEIGVNTNPSANNVFVDSIVSVDKFTYTYRVVVIDSCGNSGNISNTATTMLLKIKTDNTYTTHYLNWSPYGDFNGSILEYKIYRSFTDIYGSVLIASVSNSQFYYEDKLSFQDTLSKACYYIDAIESPNIYGINEASKSNVECAILEPLVYIPNTFTPNGDNFNNVFKPIISYYDYSYYHLIIFDRWEHTLFETSDANTGWNGLIKTTDKMACDGTYFYLLTIKDGNGVELLKRGFINLLR
jgi:gliding motility-associated-like protein